VYPQVKLQSVEGILKACEADLSYNILKKLYIVLAFIGSFDAQMGTQFHRAALNLECKQ